MSTILNAAVLTPRKSGSGIWRLQFLVRDYSIQLTSFISLDKESPKIKILFQFVANVYFSLIVLSQIRLFQSYNLNMFISTHYRTSDFQV